MTDCPGKSGFDKIAKPFTPDIIVYCKSSYIFIEAESDEEILKQAEEEIEAFVSGKGYTPKVLLIKGIGLTPWETAPGTHRSSPMCSRTR